MRRASSRRSEAFASATVVGAGAAVDEDRAIAIIGSSAMGGGALPHAEAAITPDARVRSVGRIEIEKRRSEELDSLGHEEPRGSATLSRDAHFSRPPPPRPRRPTPIARSPRSLPARPQLRGRSARKPPFFVSSWAPRRTWRRPGSAWRLRRRRASTLESPLAGEEWLAGPFATLTNIRLLADSLDQIALRGRPDFRPRKRRRAARRATAQCSSTTELDEGRPPRVGNEGLRPLRRGRAHRRANAPRRRRPTFYREGSRRRRLLVLGAGNVSSIPPMGRRSTDLLVDGRVVLLKMNPVLAYLGPHFEHALAPLHHAAASLRIVYGGGEIGGSLATHFPRRRHPHHRLRPRRTTSSCWVPPGPDRDRRKARERSGPKEAHYLRARQRQSRSSIAPLSLRRDGSRFHRQASIATQVVNNGSFSCHAAKMLVLPKGWAAARASSSGLMQDVARRRAAH